MPETHTTRRLKWLLWILLLWVGVIFGRLVSLQVFQHDELLRMAQKQQQREKPIPALRGAILDRTGQPLAKTLPAESILVNPMKIPDASVAADLLSRFLGLDRAKVYNQIAAAKRRSSGFLWIKRKADAEEAERLRGLKLDWVEFRPEMRRYYPHGALASHVVGSIGISGAAEDVTEAGNAGIELAFDDELAGRPGLEREYTDVKQNVYDSVVSRKPEPGATITLTIDPNLQFEAEKELDKAMVSSGAKTGSIVALNPNNGDVLAMANSPRFDPNLPPGPNEPPNARSNLAISTPFEPGSVFKVVTLSAALETTKLTPDTIMPGGSQIKVYDRVIKDEHAHGPMSMADILAHSSNVGAIQIGSRVGDRALYKYQRRFGFGQKTGIDLPGESSGLLRRVENWNATSIAFLSIGHEISVTSLQLALAGAAIANGGMLLKPRLVLSRQRPGQPAEVFPQEKPERIIAPETAIQMRRMMEGVVLRGTGKGYANLKGYTSGGKTGTAMIFDLKAKVYTHKYNASFLGFAPVANPQIVIIVTLEGTSGGTAGFGAPVAAPVFREVAMKALRMADVPQDLPDGSLRTSLDSSDSKDVTIAGMAGAPQLLQRPSGPRSVSSVTMPPVQADSPASAGDSASSHQGSFSQESSGRRPFSTGSTPDYRGMTLRAVLEESSAAGVAVEVQGTGLARNQQPPPGSPLPQFARVRVQFGR
jgi:cell division protein FtsI (penicillin-binding protein 3)